MLIYGIVLIAFGILYLMKPLMYYNGIWKKWNRASREKTPEEYKKYMQKVAILFLVGGIVLILLNYSLFAS